MLSAAATCRRTLWYWQTVVSPAPRSVRGDHLEQDGHSSSLRAHVSLAGGACAGAGDKAGHERSSVPVQGDHARRGTRWESALTTLWREVLPAAVSATSSKRAPRGRWRAENLLPEVGANQPVPRNGKGLPPSDRDTKSVAR